MKSPIRALLVNVWHDGSERADDSVCKVSFELFPSKKDALDWLKEWFSINEVWEDLDLDTVLNNPPYITEKRKDSYWMLVYYREEMKHRER